MNNVKKLVLATLITGAAGLGLAAEKLAQGVPSSQGGAETQGMGNRESMSPAAQTPAERLQDDMRRLWSEHVIWLRNVIIASLAGTPDQKEATDRLMKNQDDIGNAMAPYYGRAAGEQLTKLLKEHETIGSEVIKAAKAGNKTAQQDADKRWHQNAMAISEFLSKANPNWSKATLSDMMDKHLSTTTDEVTARLNKNWGKDIKAFDATYEHALGMADALTEGIIKQFPEKFSQQKVGKR